MKKSGTYYLQSPAEVLRLFESRKEGLSSDEARERLSLAEPFNFANFTGQSTHKPSKLLTYSTWHIGLLLLIGFLAVYLSHIGLGVLLFSIALINGLAVGFFERRINHNPSLQKLRMPKSAHVYRSGKLTRIHINHLVPGDVILLEPGDIVPGDARIVTSKRLLVSESALNESFAQQTKHGNTLLEHVPRSKQTNMVFFGSQIISGSATAVITAIGTHTELLSLQRLSPKAQRHTAADGFAKLQLYATIAAFTLGSTTLFIGPIIDLPTWQILQLTALICIAASLTPAYIALTTASAHRGHIIKKLSGGTLMQLSSLGPLAHSPTLMTDIEIATNAKKPYFTKLYIGTSLYNLAKALPKNTDIDSLQQAYTIGRLLDDSATSAAFKALRKLEPSLSFKSHTKIANLPDIYSHLEGGIWQHNENLITAASGTITDILAVSTKIWDHGHIRTLTTKDRDRITSEAEEYSQQSLAYAYCDNSEPDNLIFVGLLLAEPSIDSHTKNTLLALKRAGTQTIFVSQQPLKNTHRLLISAGFTPKEYTIVTSKDLIGVSQQTIAQTISKTILVLHGLSPQEITLVAKAARKNGPLAIVGDALAKIEILAQADTIITGSRTASSHLAHLTLPNPSLTYVHTAVREASVFSIQAAVLFKCARFITATVGILVTTLTLMYFFFNATPLLSPPLITATLLTLTPLLVACGWLSRTDSKQSVRGAHDALLALIAAAIVIAGAMLFLSLNNISGVNLGVHSLAYQKAVTIGFLLLTACLGLYVVFHITRVRRPDYLRSMSFFALLIVAALLYGSVYNFFLQDMLSTYGLSTSELAIVGYGISVFALLGLLLHFDHKHTRKSVTKLHLEHKK